MSFWALVSDSKWDICGLFLAAVVAVAAMRPLLSEIDNTDRKSSLRDLEVVRKTRDPYVLMRLCEKVCSDTPLDRPYGTRTDYWEPDDASLRVVRSSRTRSCQFLPDPADTGTCSII